MSKQEAQKIAKSYIQSHKTSFGKVSKREIDTAIKKVAGALKALPARMPPRVGTTHPSTGRCASTGQILLH